MGIQVSVPPSLLRKTSHRQVNDAEVYGDIPYSFISDKYTPNAMMMKYRIDQIEYHAHTARLRVRVHWRIDRFSIGYSIGGSRLR